MKKAIAIIGSGTMAVAISEVASRSGIESHCFSNDKNAVVIGRCTEHHLINIFDIEGIVNVCKGIGVSGIIATTELTVAIASRISKLLKLNGMPLSIAEHVTNKGFVRDRVDDSCGILQPKHKVIKNRNDISIDPLSFPVIVKPTSLGGKRGILVAKNQDEYVYAINYAYENMPKDRQEIIVEEYLDGGREFSIESLSYHGKHKVIQVTEKITSVPPHIVELGHLQPARITSSQRKRIEEAMPKLLDMVGIDNTSTHTEIKIINDRLYLIELNARPGGDNIAYRLVELSTGFSYLGGAIDIALNDFKFPNDEDLDKNTSGLIYVTSQTEYMKSIFESCDSYDWCIEKQKISDELKEIVTNSSWNTNYMIFKSSSGIPTELKKFYPDIDIIDNY